MAEDKLPHTLTDEELALATSLTRTIEGMLSTMPPHVVGEVIERLSAQRGAERR